MKGILPLRRLEVLEWNISMLYAKMLFGASLETYLRAIMLSLNVDVHLVQRRKCRMKLRVEVDAIDLH